MSISATALQAWQWQGDVLKLLDQRRLPQHSEWFEVRNVAEAAEAIRQMVVRCAGDWYDCGLCCGLAGATSTGCW